MPKSAAGLTPSMLYPEHYPKINQLIKHLSDEELNLAIRNASTNPPYMHRVNKAPFLDQDVYEEMLKLERAERLDLHEEAKASRDIIFTQIGWMERFCPDSDISDDAMLAIHRRIADRRVGLLLSVGSLVGGSRWQSYLACSLGVSDRMVRCWVRGDVRIPDNVIYGLRRMLYSHSHSIGSITEHLERHIADMEATSDPDDHRDDGQGHHHY